MLDLTLVANPPAVQEAVADAVRRIRRADPFAPVLVVGRSVRLNRALQRRSGPTLNVHFLTLEQLANQLLFDADPAGRRPSRHSLEIEQLVLTLIEELLPESPILSGAVPSPRTAAALYQTLRDFKDASIPPDRLLEVAVHPDLRDAGKLREIIRLYALYEKALHTHKLLDPPDVLRLAARAARRSPLVASARRILVAGYADMTQTQFDLLEALARSAPVEVFFLGNMNERSSAPALRFYEGFLRGLCERTGGRVRRLPGAPRTAAGELPAGLFRAEIRPVRGARVELASVSGRHDELWFCAKRILDLLDRGVRPGDIGVVARTLEPYADLLEPVFGDHAIPFVTSAKRSVRSLPLVRTLERILELVELDYERAAVMEVLASGFLRLPEGSDPVQWELEASRRAIGRGVSAWMSRLPGGPFRDSFVRLETTLRSLPARAPWSRFVDAVLAIWDRLLAVPLGEDLREAVLDLKALDGVTYGRVVERDRFIEMLRERFERATVPLGGRNIEGVQVLDVMAARGLVFRHLFLIGLNERVFPRPVHEDPFIGDHNRRVLSDLLGVKLEPKLDAIGEERMLFTMMLEAATEGLVLTYQRADDEGRPLSPSPFLREVVYRLPASEGKTFEETMAAAGTIVSRLPEIRLREIARPEHLTPAELLMRAAFSTVDEDEVEKIRRERSEDPRRLVRCQEFARRLEQNRRLGDTDGLVGGAVNDWWESYQRRVSPTMIETYTQCPAKAWFGRVLRLDPFERPEEEEELDARDLGTLVHRILESFYRRLRPGTNETRARALLRAIWKREREAAEADLYVRHPLEWEARTEQILDALNRFLFREDLPAQKQGVAAFLTEREGRVDIGGVGYSGKLDRIVVLKGGEVWVDDYKWKQEAQGRPEDEALRGRAVQLPLYERMARRELGGCGAGRFRARLILLKTLLRFGSLKEAVGETGPRLYEELPGDFWERRGKEFEQTLGIIIRHLQAGRFFVRPGPQCMLCEYRLACRRTHVATLRRVQTDPVVEDFRGLDSGR